MNGWLVGGLFAIIFMYVYRMLVKPSGLREEQGARPALAVMVLAGLAVRFVMAYQIPGFDIDVGTFKAWAGIVASEGPGKFYSSASFSDYPPGYMYVLYVIGLLQRGLALGWDSAAMNILIKTPAMLADAAIAILLYRWAEAGKQTQLALGAAALVLFNPAFLINSAAWGQVDSFFALFVILFVRWLERDKWPAAGIIYALAVLIKPQALLFGPLIALIMWRRRRWQEGALGALYGLAAFVLGALPFTGLTGLPKLGGLYFNTLASYPYASLNAYNLMSLAGGNFVQLSERFGPLTYGTWSIVLMAGTYAAVAWLYLKSKDTNERLALLAGATIILVFVLTAKMHERYLFYALPLLIIGAQQWKDKRLLWLIFGWSLLFFANVQQALSSSYSKIYHLPAADPQLLAGSAAAVLLLGYTLMVLHSIFMREKVVSWELQNGSGQQPGGKKGRGAQQAGGIRQPVSSSTSFFTGWLFPLDTDSSNRLDRELNENRTWRRLDLLLLGSLLLVYTILAFIHLGDSKAPQTAWEPQTTGESVLIAWSEAHQLARMNSFAGIGDGSLRAELSDDGVTWRDEVNVEINVFKGFSWQSALLDKPARFARVTVVKPGFTLYELAFFAREGGQPLQPDRVTVIQPGTNVSATGVPASPEAQEAAAKLFDEPLQTAFQPSYLNGAYFDEVYYVRAAYELLHGMTPYESTHPPLGKWLIAMGVSVFGFHPFGWRIVGTLFGVAMIAVMYWLAKRCFGKSKYAFAAAFLLTFDSLHFVQTRIATIDVYTVFFTLLMFGFMLSFVDAVKRGAGPVQQLVPFALSGISFGLGAAVKWNAVYAGLGLLVLWLWAAYQTGREDRRRLVPLVFWSMVFFVVIPIVIYCATFVPQVTAAGSTQVLADIWQAQKQMYAYHSQLHAEHPFSSPWWQWPVMTRPVWYFAGVHMPPGVISSIVAIGNPLVWWLGFAAVLALMAVAVRNRTRLPVFVCVAFFSQLVPWMFVQRLTFLYHYFPLLPFSILALVYAYRYVEESARQHRRIAIIYLVLVALVFFLFYPVLSGAEVSTGYAQQLRWFKSWYFFSG
ncbi:glycosyltransferase family 39 protein [Paenibacillus sp. y28]|uniref:glycosyltransferase family 39 protein n=1 Tax=Paenibacillus sp. y28 TaxID=3129110 RepID=UPI003018964D